MGVPINILTIAVVIYFILCVVDGYKKGLVGGIIRIVTSVLALAVLYVLLKGLASFLQGNVLYIIMALILLVALSLIRKLTKLILDSCKLVTMLPVIHWLDKLAGAILGIAEGILVIWVLFTVLGFFKYFGAQEWVMNQISASRLLSILYHTNYVVYFLAKL